MRTRCRFGLKRRFVATIECDREFPVEGFFPQMAHTLDMRRAMVADVHARRCARPRAAALTRLVP